MTDDEKTERATLLWERINRNAEMLAKNTENPDATNPQWQS